MGDDKELKKAWERIVRLERAVFNQEAPLDNAESNFKRLESALEKQSYDIKQHMKLFGKRISSVESLEEKFKASQEELRVKTAEIEKLHKEKEDLENEKNEQISQLSFEKTDLERENRKLQEVVEKTNGEKEGLQERVGKLNEEKEELQEKVEKLNVVKEGLQEDISQKKENIDRLNREKEGLQERVGKLNEEKVELQEKVEKLDRQKVVLENERDKRDEQISQLDSQKNSLERKMEELQEEMESKRAKIKRLNEEMEDLQKKYEEQKRQIVQQKDEWSEFTSVYRKMMKAMYKCKNLAEMVEDFEMDVTKDTEDFQSVVSFVGMLGSEYTFPPLVYRYWGENPLDEDDLIFINVVNQYYREYFGLNYDILWCPADDEKKFDKDKMKDKNTSTGPFRHYSEVYAPAVMRDSEKISMAAIVRGERQ